MVKASAKMKVTALMICVLLVLQSFVVSAAGYGTTAVDAELEKDMKLLHALGIFDETYGELTMSYKVSRGEFATAVARIFGNTVSEDSTEPVSYYNDMSGLDAEMVQAVNVLTDRGLVSGAGGGTFRPDDEITYEQAIKILVCAMGYDMLAVEYGGFPAGYMTEGARLGLTDDINLSGGDPLTWEALIVMMHNAIFIDVMQTVVYGDAPLYRIISGETLLTNAMNIQWLQNVRVTANSVTSIEGSTYTNPDYVKINGMVYGDPKGYAEGYIGRAVDVYYKEVNGNREVVYAENRLERTVTVITEDIIDVNGYRITYEEENGSKKTITLAADAYMLYNGQVTAYRPELIDTAKSGRITFERSENSSGYDMVIASLYTDMIVQAVDYSRMLVYDTIQSGVALDLTKYSNDNRCLIQKNGETTDINGITTGAVLAVYNTPDDSYITVTVSGSTIDGVIETIKDDKVIVSGEAYDYSDTLKTVIANKLGDTCTFYLNHDGKIIWMETKSSGGLKFGYVTAAAETSSFETTLTLRMLTEDNVWMDYPLPSKMTINGDWVTTKTAEKVQSLLYADGKIKQQLIQYSVNEEGVLNVLNTADFTTGNILVNKSEKDFYCSLAKTPSAIRYKSSKKSFNGQATINDATKVFVVSPSVDNNTKSYAVKNTSYFSNDRTYTVAGYNMNEGGVLEALVCYASLTGFKPVYSSTAVMVDYVSETIDGEGNRVQSLHGLSNGSYVNYMTDGDTKLTTGSRTLKRGDVVRISTDIDSKICGIALDVDIDTQKTENASYEDFWDSNWAISGAVYSKAGSYAIISNTNAADLSTIFKNPDPAKLYAISLSGSVMIYDSEKDMIYAGSNEDILSYEVAGNSATRFFARFNYESLTDLFIFK
ncbi:MAG: S-layer homology domain-containing protein [Clostridia bacterium]|nr:S-layer homology domain-containing protein [Clostridia bacterium]